MRLIHFVINISQKCMSSADVWKYRDSVLGHEDCPAANSKSMGPPQKSADDRNCSVDSTVRPTSAEWQKADVDGHDDAQNWWEDAAGCWVNQRIFVIRVARLRRRWRRSWLRNIGHGMTSQHSDPLACTLRLSPGQTHTTITHSWKQRNKHKINLSRGRIANSSFVFPRWQHKPTV